MSSDEPKFKLEDLPDQGSVPEKIIVPKFKKTQADPRLKKLKKLDPAERDKTLSDRWFFDNPSRRWGWLIALLALIVLEVLSHQEPFSVAKIRESDEDLGDILALAFDFIPLETLLQHPLFLAFLIPLFFKHTKPEGLFFELNFEGLNAPDRINDAAIAIPARVFLKWSDITAVKKVRVNKREVLEIHSAKGPAAHLIWDIDDVKKKVIQQVLTDLVADKHPLRVFLEKDIT